MSKLRLQKVGGLVLEVLAEVLPRCKDPRVGFVTFTHADISPDLGQANVFVSVLGDEGQITSSIEGLKSAESFFRRELGTKIRLKKTPRINFIYDQGIQRGVDLVNLLNNLPEISSKDAAKEEITEDFDEAEE